MPTIQIADKPTLDTVKATTDTINTNTADTKAKVGATNDTGGSATAGSIFAKLNEVLTYIKGTLWTGINNIWGEVQKNNTANATGTLSQKLSKVITDVATLNTTVQSSGKVLVAKRASVSAANGTVTVVNVTGSGEFYCFYRASITQTVKITVDGVAYTVGLAGSGSYYIVRAAGSGFSYVDSLLGMIPWQFKSSLKIEHTAASTAGGTIFCEYALYE